MHDAASALGPMRDSNTIGERSRSEMFGPRSPEVAPCCGGGGSLYDMPITAGVGRAAALGFCERCGAT